MQNHNDDTIKTSEHSSLEKYTSHFIWKGLKGLWRVLLCERWVGDWTELQHTDPHSSGHNRVSFPFSWAAQPEAWGPSLCWDMDLIPASSLQLIWTSCRRGYIIIWHPLTSCGRHNFTLNSTPQQSRSPLISWYLWPDAPVIYTGTFLLLTAWLGSICNSYLMPKPSFKKNSSGTIQPIGGSYLSQGYLSEREHNSTTEVWNRLRNSAVNCINHYTTRIPHPGY